MPRIPPEFTPYLPGHMKLHDLDPPVYRATELVDLHLGRAVQAAYREGQETAQAAHKADEAIQQRRQQMRGGYHA